LDPQPVGAVGSELAVHEVIGAWIGHTGAGAALGASAGDALQSTFAHQSFDPFVVHLTTQPEPQLGGHSPGAVRAEALLVDLRDQITELGVGEHPSGRVDLGVPPRVKRRPGHLHRATTRCDRQIGTPVDDEGVDHFGRTFSLAK
jgi:hypothetical protein